MSHPGAARVGSLAILSNSGYVLIAAAALVAYTSGADESALGSADAKATRRGRETFAQACVRCHVSTSAADSKSEETTPLPTRPAIRRVPGSPSRAE